MNLAAFRALAVGFVLASLTLIPGSHAADKPDQPGALTGPVATARVRILFLGDNGHHKPADRFAQLQPALKDRGIDLTYTDKMSDLNRETLNQYDGLLIYANETRISPEQEKALVDYVRSGRGFIPLHCASYCFLNSPTYVALVGGQFKSHKTGTFTTTVVDPSHSLMKDYKGFETWDETYVHTKLGKDLRLLQVRAEGERDEPWTWTRTEGKGRVFYTAYGHDHRTFSNPGFHDLVTRGIRWAVRRDAASTFANPKMVGPDPSAKPFEYVEAEGIPFYDPKNPGRGGGAWNKMPKPLDPAESMKHLQLPAGFQAKLFVAEPDVLKPITMAWDERGRLWVVESIDYPNRITAPNAGSDRIKICEDTDGDGRADKFSIFAENLNIPFSILFSNGGLIVPEQKSTWFLKDTDGDGKADLKKELFTGWYPRGLDTHAGPSNLRYGLDNWIWGMVGYGAFQGTVGDKTLRFSQGFYRFKPDGSQLEFVRATNNNTWGIGFSDEGLVFGSTANGCPSVYMPIPNRYYESVRGHSPEVLRNIADTYMFKSPAPKVRQVDWHGGYTAAAGHALYTARQYPREYWNRTAFVTEPTGHIVGTFILEPEGTDFKSHNPFNLLASFDEWTAPIMAEVGPDGNVWVIDWYNYIVQHNPTPQGYRNGPGNAYETPRRDKQHGRIYRIVYTGDGAKPDPKPLDLSKASPAQLVDALKNDNQFWRKHAQRLLVEKQDQSVVPALTALANDQSVDELGLNVGAIHALWTLKGLNALDANAEPSGSAAGPQNAAITALKHPSAGVRRNAVAVLPPSESSLATILAANLLNDPDPQVRLATLLAIADQPANNPASAKAGAAIYAMLQKPQNTYDRWIPDAAVSAAAKHDAAFLRHVLVASRGNANAAPPRPQPAARANDPKTPANLIQNPSFEEVANGQPVGWSPSNFGGAGDPKFTVGDTAHTGARSASIATTQGVDAGWSQTVTVKPNTRYRLTAWIKTKGLDAGSGQGAQVNFHQLQRTGLTKPLTGDTDWTQVTSEFSSAGYTSLQINLLMGGWGRSTGQAWWDDLSLTEMGPGAATLANAADDRLGKLGVVVRIVARHYAERAPVESVVATLDSLKGADRDLATSILDGLVSGWPDATKPTLSDADKSALADLGKALAPDQRDRLLVLANRWGQSAIFAGQLDEVLKTVKATLTGEGSATGERVDAAKRLLRLSDTPESVNAILAQVNPKLSSDAASLLVNSLADSRLDDAASLILARWPDLTPAARKAAVGVMMRRTPWTAAMLAAVQDKKLLRGDLTASDWQVLRLHRERSIASLARKLDAASMDPDRQKLLDKLLPVLDRPGDVAAGKALFTARCAQCHTLDGVGGKVAPELTGIAAKDPKEILADIVDPNRSVEANYRLWTIDTTEGDSYSGRLDTETQTTVEIFDALGEKHVIQRKDIATMNASQLSIMPVGLIDDLKPDDIANLMAYLKSAHHK